jgi:glycosidase
MTIQINSDAARHVDRKMAFGHAADWLQRCCLVFVVGTAAMFLAAAHLFAATDAALGKAADSPAWTKDLIIYELATKGFTSPNGPESGTFNTCKKRMPYLKKLGITGIWLTGHSWAPPHLFFNVWSQYGNIEPDKIEPTLGTPREFKALIDEAHRNGIKVFLDVHEHGVHPCSPIVKAHPEWFKGDAGGICDFDWRGAHEDREEWWIKVWTDYVKNYGVDGFRIDLGTPHPHVWKKIRQIAAAAGHEIVTFEEDRNCAVPGVTDFSQCDAEIREVADDVGGFYERQARKDKCFSSVMLSSHDFGTNVNPLPDNPYAAQGSRAVFGYSVLFTPMIPIFFSGEEFDASFNPIPWLSPKYLPSNGPKDMQEHLRQMYAAGCPSYLAEEDKGKGRWLYGNMIDWEELNEPKHHAMFEDVRKMMAIRKKEADILAAVPDRDNPKIKGVKCESNASVPVPYIRWNGRATILVAANRNTDKDANLKISIPLEKIGMAGHARYKVTDLWMGGEDRICSAADLAAFEFPGKRDKIAGGGIRIFKIEPLNASASRD